MIASKGGIVFPDGRRILDSCDLGNMAHHINVSQVDDVS